jgi:cell division protein FtsL
LSTNEKRTDWELLFEHFDALNLKKDHMKELQEEIAWTERHLKSLKQELKELQRAPKVADTHNTRIEAS